MGKRRKAREAAIQYHFWRDLQRGDGPEKIEDFWEFCPAKPRVREFAQPLIEGMVAHLPERSEEHTSELQSHSDLVCRLLLEKKKHKSKGGAKLPTREGTARP